MPEEGLWMVMKVLTEFEIPQLPFPVNFDPSGDLVGLVPVFKTREGALAEADGKYDVLCVQYGHKRGE